MPRSSSKSIAFAMRKYYKLALFVATGFSVVFLIFYKSQYDKLYNVLQVLEYFGKDGAGGPPDRYTV